MTTIAEQLRAAALGPTPPGGISGRIIGDWLNGPIFGKAAAEALWFRGTGFFSTLTDEDQRMFLLFVACAVEADE